MSSLRSFLTSTLTGRPISWIRTGLRRWGRLVAGGVTLLGVVALAVCLNGDNAGHASAEEGTDPAAVTVDAVTATPATRTHHYHGVTRAAERSSLGFAMGGRLAARPVQLGDRVAAGDVLARLDEEPLHNARAMAAATVADLEARAEQLRRDRERAEALADVQALPAQKLEQIEAQERSLQANLEAARAQLREARRTLGEATLRAPFDGVVREVLAEPGEVVGPGFPVVLLSGDGALEVEVEVPESVVGRLITDGQVLVSFPVAGIDAAEGQILSVGGSAGAPGRLFPVVVGLEPGGGALPGMTATVALQVPLEPSLSVPLAAVADPTGTSPVVVAVRGETAHRIAVEVLDLHGGRVAVRGALQAGDEVVVGGHGALADGAAVQVLR